LFLIGFILFVLSTPWPKSVFRVFLGAEAAISTIPVWNGRRFLGITQNIYLNACPANVIGICTSCLAEYGEELSFPIHRTSCIFELPHLSAPGMCNTSSKSYER